MIIGIDGNEANQNIRVGSGVYAFELLKQFSEIRKKNLEFRIYLKEKPLNDLPTDNDNWQYKIVRPQKVWTQIGLPITLWKEKVLGKAPDVFFTPSHYAPRFCPVPSVVTIFDLSFIRYPKMFVKKDLYQLRNWTDYSVKQAVKIITISQFSKKEIADYYKIDPNKIIVAYPGYDRERFNTRIKNQESRIRDLRVKYKIDSDYILYIGTIQPRKNLVRLVEAFTMLKHEQHVDLTKDLKLVISGMIDEGRGGWMNEEILNRLKNLEFRIKNDIRITGFVQNEDLPYLMAGAKALVLPSLYEGFGIPAVEAMACGVPVVVSNTSSLPEVIGDCGIFIDPNDNQSILNGLQETCYNDPKRDELIKRGLEQVKKYNWVKSAKIIVDTLFSLPDYDRN